jgi:hypothetical protein
MSASAGQPQGWQTIEQELQKFERQFGWTVSGEAQTYLRNAFIQISRGTSTVTPHDATAKALDSLPDLIRDLESRAASLSGGARIVTEPMMSETINALALRMNCPCWPRH